MSTEEEALENDESLIALTTHFAQVQFRLKQIISADSEHKEELLKDLEKFAFQGCGKPMVYDTAASGENGSTESQRQVRLELMEKLRDQLDDIEKVAQEATTTVSEGVASASSDGQEGACKAATFQNTLAEKQRIIIEELRKRFNFQFGDLERLSTEEVKKNVKKVVRDVVDPIKTKEEYVGHLQSQIKDLERYITFLQTKQQLTSPTHSEATPTPSVSAESCATPTLGPNSTISPPPPLTGPCISLEKYQGARSKHVTFAKEKWEGFYEGPPTPKYRVSMMQLDGVGCAVDATRCEWEKMDSLGKSLNNAPRQNDLQLSLLVMKKTLALVEVLTLCQCGGSLRCLPKYVSDGKRKRYHMALQSLEMAVDKISIISSALSEAGSNSDSMVSLETDLHETVSMLLADSLRVLVEHGLMANGRPVALTDGCFPAWRKWGKQGLDSSAGECAAWRVFMYYYNMKHGEKFSSRADQLLSSSFALSSNSTSVKKTLLSSMSQVMRKYSSSYHLSHDTKFRALICEGFNLCHLAEWFKMLASNPSIGDDLYTSSAFITATGFRPAIACLERLKDNPTCDSVSLPHHFYQSQEAFIRK